MLKCQSAFPCTSVHLDKARNTTIWLQQFARNKMSKVAIVMSLHVSGASSGIGMFGRKRFGQRCPAGVLSLVVGSKTLGVPWWRYVWKHAWWPEERIVMGFWNTSPCGWFFSQTSVLVPKVSCQRHAILRPCAVHHHRHHRHHHQPVFCQENLIESPLGGKGCVCVCGIQIMNSKVNNENSHRCIFYMCRIM